MDHRPNKNCLQNPDERNKPVYNEDDDDSYDVAFMKMKYMYEYLLLSTGDKYRGESLQEKEALSPLIRKCDSCTMVKKVFIKICQNT